MINWNKINKKKLERLNNFYYYECKIVNLFGNNLKEFKRIIKTINISKNNIRYIKEILEG